MEKQGLKALIFGSTGAIGSELVASLLASPKWTKVVCIARKQLEEWKALPNQDKLVVETAPDLDDYFKQENNKYAGFDSLFCCFGSQTKHGEQTFIKVDKTYPLWAADIALKNKIPHYLLVSSMGSKATSWFLYPRVKGEVQMQLQKKKLNLLTIMKPGLLRNRKDARTVEKFLGILPFVPGIQARDAAEVLRIHAERCHEQALKAKEAVQVLENKDMLNLLQS